MVAGMSDEQMEPGNMTERFRAFAQSVDPEPSRIPLLVLMSAGAVAVLAVIVLILWLLIAN